jgi:prolyl-tRNA synthetase
VRLSTAFLPTFREAATDRANAAERMAVRAGLVARMPGGVYCLLPIGEAVVRNILQIIRRELAEVGAQTIGLPALQPIQWWMPETGSGRWSLFGDDIISCSSARQRYCLSPSSEELIVNVLVRCGQLSYRRFPILLHSSGRRFRLATSGYGLHRAQEFLLDEIYGFAGSPSDISGLCDRVEQAFWRIFDCCGISAIKTAENLNSAIGHRSANFYAASSSAHDRLILRCASCRNGFEFPGPHRQDTETACSLCGGQALPTKVLQIGQISRLGSQYCQVFQLQFTGPGNTLQYPEMCGCGLSINRLMVAALEQNRDQHGPVWPPPLSPFELTILSVPASGPSVEMARLLWQDALQRKIAALWDDRDIGFGEKAADADLFGIPLRVTIGPKSIERNAVDLRFRHSGESKLVGTEELPDIVAHAVLNIGGSWSKASVQERRRGQT